MRNLLTGLIGLLMPFQLMSGQECPAAAKTVEQLINRTTADMRSLVTAIEAYSSDHARYPSASNIAELKIHLEATYIRGTPERDAWGTSYLYLVSPDGRHFRLVSAANDRLFQEGSEKLAESPLEAKVNAGPDDDLIYETGSFRRLPDRLKKLLSVEHRHPKPQE